MAIKFAKLSALALALAVTYVPVVAQACDMEKEDWVVKVADKLNLSKDQKTKIHDYAQKAQTEIDQKHQDLHMLHSKINEDFRSTDFSEDKIDGLADDETKIVGSIIKIRMHERYNIRSVLDAKQKEKMDHMIADWEMKHQKK